MNETPAAAQIRYLLSTLDAHSIVRGIKGGPPGDVERIRRADVTRLIGSVSFPCSDGLDPNLLTCFVGGGDWPDLDWLRGEILKGRSGAIGKCTTFMLGLPQAVLHDNAARLLDPEKGR